jgi:hypothetical protein
MNVDFAGTGFQPREKRRIVGYLRRAGSECVSGPDAVMRYSLTLTRQSNGSVRWSMADSVSGTTIAGGNSSFTGRPPVRCATLVQAILEELYAVH